MKAVLSCTDNDLYLFNLPFAIYSWLKIGIDVIVIVPHELLSTPRFMLVRETIVFQTTHDGRTVHTYNFSAPKDKEVTYAQCSRLYAAALGVASTEVLITSDADMAVFDHAFWDEFDGDGWINVIGSDLVPTKQVPLCYITMPAVGWATVMQTHGKTLQQCLDGLLGHIEAENFRGNYWGKDQETAYEAITSGLYPIQWHKRASPGTQFATRRADRDGWQVTPDIIDAHLPRPGYTDENFAKIVDLFATMYPDDSTHWMYRYRDQYLKLMENGNG